MHTLAPMIFYTKNTDWVGKIAQQIKALATKPSNLNSIPGTHMMQGEALLASIGTVCMWCRHTHRQVTHTHKKNKTKQTHKQDKNQMAFVA